jgi:hypothetical protein
VAADMSEGSAVILSCRLVCLDERKKHSVSSQTLFGPIAPAVVVLRNGRHASRECHPGLLGGREDVNVRWQQVRVVQGADPDEFDQRSETRIRAPDRDPAFRAASDKLTTSALGRRVNELRFRAELSDSIRLDQGIECERSAGLSLAPATMTTVHDEWSRFDPVSDRSAITASFSWKRFRLWHGQCSSV